MRKGGEGKKWERKEKKVRHPKKSFFFSPTAASWGEGRGGEKERGEGKRSARGGEAENGRNRKLLVDPFRLKFYFRKSHSSLFNK